MLQGCASNPLVSKYAVIAPDGIAAIHGQPVWVKAAPTPDFIVSTNAEQATMTVGMLLVEKGTEAVKNRRRDALRAVRTGANAAGRFNVVSTMA